MPLPRFAALACILMAVPLSGCFAAWAGEPIELPYAELSKVTVSSDYDLVSRALMVHITGQIMVERNPEVFAVAYIVEGPCPLGPTSKPPTWLARESRSFASDERKTSPVELEVSAIVRPGQYSVRVILEGNVGLGDPFADCRTVTTLA